MSYITGKNNIYQQLSPYFLNPPGKKLPFNKLEEVLGFCAQRVAVFTDFAGEDPRNDYYVAAFLVCAWDISRLFAHELIAIRKENGIKFRRLQFKKRGDILRKPVYKLWLQHLRCFPSILLSFSFPKDLASELEFREAMKANRESLAQVGITISKGIPLRLQLSMSIFPLIIPLMKEKQQLVWIIDEDPLIDGIARNNLMSKSLVNLIRDILERQDFPSPLILSPRNAGTYKEQIEEMLCVPDLLAGVLSSTLHRSDSAKIQFETRYRDIETADIAQVLSTFEQPDAGNSQPGTQCKMFTRCFTVDVIDGKRKPGIVGFAIPNPFT